MAGAPAAVMAHPGALAPFGLYAPGMNKLVTRLIAPRDTILPPSLAAFLDRSAAKVDRLGPIAGRLAVPYAYDRLTQ